MIVLKAPTLLPTLQMWHEVIFVQQKDAIEAVIAFMEQVFGLIAESNQPMFTEERKVQHGQLLRGHALEVGPGLVGAIFKLIVVVPTRYVQDMLPSVLGAIRSAFPQEFPAWLGAALQQLPPSVASMV